MHISPSCFHEHHTHSEYSNTHLIDCTNKITSLIDHAVQLGLHGLSLTDHECLSGHIKALNHMKAVKEKYPDFQLILGNEIYLCHDCDLIPTGSGKVNYAIESGQFYHFILLAKDALGHRQLRELSSRAWGRCYSYKGVERLPTFYSDFDKIVSENKGHLIASTACLGGEFDKLLLAGDIPKTLEFVSWCWDIFGKENFFVEIQPGRTEDQILFNTRAIKFCKHFGLQWLVTNDVHYLSKEKRELHEVYLKSHEEEREAGDFYESTYFKTPDEIMERMRDYIDEEDIQVGIQNSIRIAAMCKDAGDYGLFHDTIVPQRPLPDFHVTESLDVDPQKYPYIHLFYVSDEEQDLFLMRQLEIGMVEKNQPFDHKHLSRINIELEQIYKVSEKLKQPVSSYYNLTQLITQIMWGDDQGGSFVGPGRGSVGGWYVGYLMDIMQLDPLKHGTHWWRHLHASRPDMPDVDLDTAACRRPHVFQATKDYFGENRCLNIITFRTETAKAAVQTACRGLGISSEIGSELSSMIPMTRGHVWTIKELVNGTEDNGFQPVTAFLNKVKTYPLLFETMQEIEGLVCGRGSHASGFYIFNGHYVEHNSLMKSPKGIDTTCWDMGDSDACSALKEDYLTIEALDKMYTCVKLLLNDGLIEWQGSLQATYDKYLHPDVIDYDSPEMWRMAADGEIVDLFQMQTAVGGEAIKRIRPTSIKELSLTNAVMRLMGNEDMNPIDRFIDFKNDLSLWYKEMNEAGLNAEEVKTLEKYLLANYGCSIEQEDVMTLVMDEKISGFDMKQANSLRKAIAKKKPKLVEENKKIFFEQGLKNGIRQQMLDYVWKYCIKCQLGYSFSANHDLPYSCIAIQEMNLAYHYPSIYWQTACLTVNASANEDNEDNRSTNYGKIAAAIGNMQSQGVHIALPDINSAGFGFTPDAKNNQIIFGLKGLVGIGDDIVRLIIDRRPYESLKDFYQKNNDIGVSSMITLVKAGCFDALENKDRKLIMNELLSLVATDKIEEKAFLDFKNFASVSSIEGFLPKEFDFAKRVVAFRSYVCKPSNLFTNKPKSYRLDATAQIFFENELSKFFTQGKGNDYYYDEQTDSLILIHSKFEKQYKSIIADLTQWLKSPDTLIAYNAAERNRYQSQLLEKYCNGSIPKWEMDSLSFYYTAHELEHIDQNNYTISSFDQIPEEPVVIGVQKRTDKKTGETISWDKYQLYRIAGTVLDRNNNKHTITLLTPSGVITVKLYSGAYTHYNRQIADIDETGKKSVQEKSWFTRGNKLLVTGIRRGDNFIPKKYTDSVFNHTICLIKSVNQNGSLDLQLERGDSVHAV